MTKRVMALLTLLVVVTVLAHSQTSSNSRCSLTPETAPTVRGLRLGLGTDQLMALFPGSARRKEIVDAIAKAKAATSGELVALSFNPATDSGKEQFAGVESVSTGLLGGRVADFSVVYGGVTWNNIDEWVAKLAETFKLPAPANWVAGPSENPNRILKCNGVAIEAAIQGGSASIRITNVDSLKGVLERASSAEEKKRREMKP